MECTPKKSRNSAVFEEEGYTSPPSKHSSHSFQKRLSPKIHRQYLSSNSKKPLEDYLNQNASEIASQFLQQSAMKPKKNFKHPGAGGIKSAVKVHAGYCSPQVKLPSSSRLFTIQTDKYLHTTRAFELTTPQKKDSFKRSLFSSDSDSDEQGHRMTQKLFPTTFECGSEKENNPTNQFNITSRTKQDSIMKVTPFNFFEPTSSIVNNRSNLQMNVLAHSRENQNQVVQKTPISQNKLKESKQKSQVPQKNEPMSPLQREHINVSSSGIQFFKSPFKEQPKSPQLQAWQNSARKGYDNPLKGQIENNFNVADFGSGSWSGNSCGNKLNDTLESVHEEGSRQRRRGSRDAREGGMLFDEEENRFEEDYEILQILGSGCFGTVYKCLNKLDKNIYAVKVTKECIRGESSAKQILKEAQALASLSACGEGEGEYIVCYHSAWIEDRQLHLAMEYCESNLVGFVLPCSRDSSEFYECIKQIFSDVVKGLHFLHSHNLVHLDLKPENILYNRNQNKFKIADLGLALIATNNSTPYSFQEGDARYLAKEVLNFYEATDLKKADIFSLATMIYQLLIKEALPCNGNEWHAIRSGFLPKLDAIQSCPKHLKLMLKAMMNPDPELRPSTGEIIDSSYMKSHLINEIKWQKILKGLLQSNINKIETTQITKRRQSLPPLSINNPKN